jgi:TRAP-type uncharacterized transport system substrate-binding protein
MVIVNGLIAPFSDEVATVEGDTLIVGAGSVNATVFDATTAVESALVATEPKVTPVTEVAGVLGFVTPSIVNEVGVPAATVQLVPDRVTVTNAAELVTTAAVPTALALQLLKLLFSTTVGLVGTVKVVPAAVPPRVTVMVPPLTSCVVGTNAAVQLAVVLVL